MSSLSNDVDDSININSQAKLAQNLGEDDLEKQKLMNEYKEELTKIQEDIATLKLVLNDKLKRENELKQLLGISFVEEIKHDFAEGMNQLKSSVAYQKTSASLKTASEKLAPTVQTIGTTMKNSLGSLRNTSVFKSFEAGLSSTFSGKGMKNSKSEFNVDDGTATSNSGIPQSKTTNGLSKHEVIQEEGKN